MPYQRLFFSTYGYDELTPVFPDDNPYRASLSMLGSKDAAMLVTGIANPRGFVRHFHDYPFKVVVDHYPDHHDFSKEDLNKLLKRFREMKGERRLIITTEKDAVRLAYNPYFPDELKPFCFYLPVKVKMIPGLDEEDFITHLKKV